MRHRSRIGAMLIVGALLAACGAEGQPGASPGGDAEDTEADQTEPQPPEEGADERAPEPPEEPEDPFADFDRDEAEDDARSYLGVSEDEVEETSMVRVVRRGDEEFPVTMDLRPGRLNLELDEQDGTYVVTRVKVETPDDPLVIE